MLDLFCVRRDPFNVELHILRVKSHLRSVAHGSGIYANVVVAVDADLLARGEQAFVKRVAYFCRVRRGEEKAFCQRMDPTS